MHLEVIGLERGDIRLRTLDTPTVVFVTSINKFDEVVSKADYYRDQFIRSKHSYVKAISEHSKTLTDYAKEMASHSLLAEEYSQLALKYASILQDNIKLMSEIASYKIPNYN